MSYDLICKLSDEYRRIVQLCKTKQEKLQNLDDTIQSLAQEFHSLVEEVTLMRHQGLRIAKKLEEEGQKVLHESHWLDEHATEVLWEVIDRWKDVIQEGSPDHIPSSPSSSSKITPLNPPKEES